MYSVRNRVDTDFASPVSRRVGAAFLAGSGLLNLAIAVRLYGYLGSESAFLALLSLLETHWAESELLARGDTISFLVGTVAPALVGIALCVGVVQCAAAVLTATGRAYRFSIAASFAGTVTVVTIPLCVAAGMLCWCSKDHFRGSAGLAGLLERSLRS